MVSTLGDRPGFDSERNPHMVPIRNETAAQKGCLPQRDFLVSNQRVSGFERKGLTSGRSGELSGSTGNFPGSLKTSGEPLDCSLNQDVGKSGVGFKGGSVHAAGWSIVRN